MELYISIAALVVSVVSVVVSVATYWMGLHREKKQATLDAFNVFQCQVLDQVNHYKKTDISKLAEDIHSQEYKEISVLLARCEHFAVGVNAGIYDLKTVRRLAGRYILALHEKMSPLIEKKRLLNHSELHYQEFEQLAKQMKKHYKK